MSNINKTEQVTSKRNYGIDLLRILAMFFVVVLHSLGHGGFLSSNIENSLLYKTVWALEIVAYCAVDVFALISGYVSYNETNKKKYYSRYFELWLQVLFYGLIISFIFNIINPNLVNKDEWLIALFPVTKNAYWYFTAYTGMFVLIPIINKGITNCSDHTLKKIFIIIFIIFSFPKNVSSIFILNAGYSFVWLVILYILGAIIKKTNMGKKTKNYQIIIGMFVLYCITYISQIYGLNIFGLEKGLYLSYVSPTILGVAILYVIYFSKIKLNERIIKCIKFAAPSSLAIYLINDNYLMRTKVINGLFRFGAFLSILEMFVIILGFSLLFVLFAILIDKIRMFLFKLFKVKEIINKFVNILDRLLNKLISS